jgi:hypothetical protein
MLHGKCDIGCSHTTTVECIDPSDMLWGTSIEKLVRFDTVTSMKMTFSWDFDDGDSMLFWIVYHYLPDHMMLHPRRQPSSSIMKLVSQLCE